MVLARYMHKVSRTALMAYSADKLYQVVNDVATYPEFLPGCESVEIIFSNEKEMQARLDLGRFGLSHSFSTHNHLKKDERIDVELLDGPFKYLVGHWAFIALDENACRIEFDLEFEFSYKTLEIAFKPIFSQMVHSMMDAFCQRAEHLYGK